MTSIILNVFSYLIWPSHPLRTILIGGCQSQPIWALPSHASPPPIDAAFTLPRYVTHHRVRPPPHLQCSGLPHWTEPWGLPSSSGHRFESPPQLRSTVRCPPSTVRCVAPRLGLSSMGMLSSPCAGSVPQRQSLLLGGKWSFYTINRIMLFTFVKYSWAPSCLIVTSKLLSKVLTCLSLVTELLFMTTIPNIQSYWTLATPQRKLVLSPFLIQYNVFPSFYS